MKQIIQLIEKDKLRVEALQCIQQLGLPHCYLAAGFIRNLVWDYLHDKLVSTPLNDIDVIYFDAHEIDDNQYLQHEALLNEFMPSVNWQVRNQAKMHIRNSDRPYLNIIDAMSFWPEKETAVAIRKTADNRYECISSFGFESLFKLQITYNDKRQRDIFEQRLISKGWLVHWPLLKVV